MNIQNEVQKIHNQYGMSEKANHKIQLLCEQYAKEYHDSEVKKLTIPAVVGRSEQLKAFLRWAENEWMETPPERQWEQMFDEYLKSL